MTVPPKYVVAGILGFALIVGWNVFLIQRDTELFKASYKETAKEQFCKAQAGWHPDCNVE